MTRKIKNFWGLSMFKRCWLCGRRRIVLFECCGRKYCNSCFSAHHEKFHIDRNVNKRTVNVNDGKFRDGPDHEPCLAPRKKE